MNGEISSTLDPLEGEYFFLHNGDIPTPDSRTLQDAIASIASLISKDEGIVLEGGAGDAFLTYDFSLRVHGDKPLKLQGQVALHGLLTDEGIHSAPGEVEAALFRILTPLRNRLMALVNRHNDASLRPTPASPFMLPPVR